ncbi:hypothetical protein Goarm_019782 [Gossypium armourianum]|uniref:Uncharacterized protein n=1 Tax=Gossypium armourianum TaxID=34283 RepID=A0A7J9IN37_9ROSI|nr:hypothetical protein [Gossypium armourianum]
MVSQISICGKLYLQFNCVSRIWYYRRY